MEEEYQMFTDIKNYHKRIAVYGELQTFEPKIDLDNIDFSDSDEHTKTKTLAGLLTTEPNGMIMSKLNQHLESQIQEIYGDKIGKINKQKLLELYDKHRWITIAKDNKFKIVFNALINTLIIYSVVTSLYYLGYAGPESGESLVDLIVWGFFIADFVLNFFTECQDPKGLLVNNLCLISKTYALNWMLFDLLSLLPLHFLGQYTAEYFLRLFRIFKMPRLFQMMNIKEINTTLHKLFDSKNQTDSKRFFIVVSYSWDLFYQVLVMLFVSYALSCMWSFYVVFIVQHDSVQTDFIDYFSLDLYDNWSRMIRTWYFIYTTLMTVGYGDFYATNRYEMGLCILVLIIGPTWYAYAMGRAINTIRLLEQLDSNEENVSEIDTFVSTIGTHYNEIPDELKERITNHFIHYLKKDRLGFLAEKYWTYTSKKDYGTFHNPVLAKLPEKYRNSVLDFLFQEIFFNFRIFFGTGSFKYQICLHIQPRVYHKDFKLIQQGHIPLEILFVQEGQIVCGLEIGGNFNLCYEFKQNSIIGDYFVLNKIPSHATFITKTLVTGFAIRDKVVKNLMKKNETHYEKYNRFSKKNFNKIDHNLKTDARNMKKNANDNAGEEEKQLLNPVPKRNNRASLKRPYLTGKKLDFRSEDPDYIKKIYKKLNTVKMSQENLILELKDKFKELLETLKNEEE